MARVNDQAEPVWGQPAEIYDGQFDGWTVTSPRVDGSYRIARSVIEQTRQLQPTEKAKLTTWIVDQHRLGESEPLITSDTLRALPDRRTLTYKQKVGRFFALLRSLNFGVGKAIRVSGLVDEFQQTWMNRLSAWMEVSNDAEVSFLLQALEQDELLSKQGEFYRLTSAGLIRLDETAPAGAESDQAFVAMWFSPDLEDAYLDGFEAGITDNGYVAMRIDRKEHINKIDDEIIAEIRRSRFLVADFTCELIQNKRQTISVPRGGVYYEAGFAQGLGIPVIWTVRSDCIGFVHFDTRQYAHIVWEDAADLRRKLANRIGAVIGPRSPYSSNP